MSGRPTYETQDNRRAEQRAATLLAERWACEVIKLPVQYRIDVGFVRGRALVAWGEIKVRGYSMDQISGFGGYLLSLAKWQHAADLSKATGLPFVLAVQTTCGLHAATFRDFDKVQPVVGGRRDRADWQDVEPVVLIDVASFRRVA